MNIDVRGMTIFPQSTLKEALQVIDEKSMGIVLVIDVNNRLLGTLSDGDVRRGLLGGFTTATLVKEIMNTEPTVATNEISDKEIIFLMEKNNYLILPVVDSEGLLISVINYRDFIAVKKHENPVFIMAGGFGTRLRPLTNDCPKPLLKVGSKPILEIILLHCISHGFKNFYISTHYLPEMIMDYFGDGKKWGVDITYVHEEKPLGTAGALGLLPADINQLPLLMLNGDVLTNMNLTRLMNFHENEHSDSTMCVREFEYKVPYGVIQSEGVRILSMEEKPTHYFHVNAGIYVVNPEVYKSVSSGSIIDMPTLLEKAIAENKSINLFPLHEYWLDIGRMDDYKRAQVDIETLGFE